MPQGEAGGGAGSRRGGRWSTLGRRRSGGGGEARAAEQRLPAGMPARPLRGTVRWYNSVRGYGFIERADGGGSVFVHHRSVLTEGRMLPGARVSFELEEDARGPFATHVRVLPDLTAVPAGPEGAPRAPGRRARQGGPEAPAAR